MFRGKHMRIPRIVPAAIAVLVLGSLVGTALAHGGGSKKFHSCVSKTTGALRVVKPTKGCKAGEYALDWNKKGKRGKVGPKGATGAAGLTGLTGATGARMWRDRPGGRVT